MKIMAIDTTSNVATVAIIEDSKLIGEFILNHKKTHSQKIMPMIEELMKSAELDINDIDIFAAANGPGSFTGLRIGVATIKALAHATKRRVVGVSTLESLAYNLPYCKYIICPIMDARRNQVYNGVYEWDDNVLKVIHTDRAIDIAQCLDDLKSHNKKVVFLGDGVDVHREYIKERMGEDAIFANSNVNAQRASSVAQCAYEKAQKGEDVSFLDLAPFYLRKSQAEREYDEKHNKIERGI